MPRKVKLTESAEDFLEAIYLIGKTKKVVRVKDIAQHLNIKMASVVVGLKSLAEKGLVEHEHYGYVELTPPGEEIAKKTLYRHQLLFKFFHEVLGLPGNIADRDACRIEHYLSSEGLERILKFIEFMEKSPEGGPKWLTNFYYFLQYKQLPKACFEKRETLISLEQLDTQAKGKVQKLGGQVELKQELLKKGVVPGVIVTIKEKVPEGINVKLNDSVIFLMPKEAKEIFVIPI